ncbi:MAG TPA: Hsp20/alpha crystallin family protein [Planctomycetaceae bacterium]|nr:Hsp20/alpha crystallin family protein [Planctomycetaceae bacterium]
MTEPDVRPESGPLTASVERLRHELDRWLEAAMEQGGRALNAIGLRGIRRPFQPAVDVVEGDDEIVAYSDIPGCDADLIEVSVTGNMLTIKGLKPGVPPDEGRAVHISERPAGEFSRSIPLPAPVNAEAVSAVTRDGVLTIRLSKTERAKSRHIRVTSGGAALCDPVAAGGPPGTV